MADARALLRAHRADNRIKHPHATYSDAGKLLCKLCHETVKSESLWDGHVRGANHRRNLAAATTVQTRTQPTAGDDEEEDVRGAEEGGCADGEGRRARPVVVWAEVEVYDAEGDDGVDDGEGV